MLLLSSFNWSILADIEALFQGKKTRTAQMIEAVDNSGGTAGAKVMRIGQVNPEARVRLM